ncbi:MAG TPA: RNA 2',3'-cyclic phosphodiesterase [Ramlibacter sp.]|uniref:RNA 2',3'-cyclic phosphodiesterase n=1 Tax=Ramlibacter sp. TaxID=1917967 RepID=UPI002ED0F5E2
MDTAAPSSLRLFLGLWPTTLERIALERHAHAWQWPASARHTPPERLHLTLHFLGEVASGRLPDLKEGLEVEWGACELLLDVAQVWPGGIAVLEAGTVPPELLQLHAVLGERLTALGMVTEARRYRPHATLARKAFGARPPAGFEPLRWRTGPHYHLVRSLPGGRGYETLQVFG